MARPTKHDDWLVHRMAELIRYSNLPFSTLPERFRRNYPDITNTRDIQCFVGKILCSEWNPEYRSWFFRQVADALAGKSGKKRKSGEAEKGEHVDELEKTRAAWRKAKAKLTGPYRDDNPTFQEVDDEFYQANGWHLHRRALPALGCHCRPDKRGRPKKLPRALKADSQKHRGKKPSPAIQSLPR
jgi:hypothetical protein